MHIRELVLFKHLATTLHFGKTSMECNITPSGLTRTIKRLENEVGKPLFLRNNRSVFLTPAGFTFKDYCEESIQRWNVLQNSLKSDTVLRGEISLYCSVTAILSILPQILIKFRKSHPEVVIHVQTGDAAKALHKIHNSEADISIAALPDRHPESLEFIKILTTPLIFIFPKQFSQTIIYTNKKINWSKTPVILPTEGLSRQRVERWFADKKTDPNIYSQVSGNEAIIAMVSMGCGVGIVPRLVLEKSSLKNQVEILDISPQLKPFSVGACTSIKNKRNPVVQAFWNIVETLDKSNFETL